MTSQYPNQYLRLRAERLAESTREFLARGKSVVRCESCQLAQFACICPWRPSLTSRCEFVLLMHRNEVFKPTNTGRLIADLLPGQTHVFCWSRTEPSEELLALLSDSRRRCVLVFPMEAGNTVSDQREVIGELPEDDKLTTFILLDGTWKQSGRMFHLSRWLDSVPCVQLPESIVRGYAVRKSHQEHYVSTAEAGGLCLLMAQESRVADALFDYFQLFNIHYLATRAVQAPAMGELHSRLLMYR